MIFPPRCLGCGVLNEGLCRLCSIIWILRSHRAVVGRTPIFSSLRYNSSVSRILLSAKEDGIAKADELLLLALHSSLLSAIENLGMRPLLVPIPSSARAIRRRGREFVFDMTVRVGARENMPVQNLLQHNRRVLDQSQLNGSERFQNLAGAISLKVACGRPREVIIVDDLITTGATLNEAVRALEIGGFRVLAGITAFVALPLR